MPETEETPSDEQAASAPAEGAETTADDGAWDEDGGGWDDEGGAGIPREKAVRIAQIALVALAVIVVIAVLVSKGGDKKDDAASGGTGSDGKTTQTTAAKPKKAQWPTEVSGRPAQLGKTNQPAPEVNPKAAPGVYLWSDFDGWHLWTVGGEGVPAINGTLTSGDVVDKAVLAVPGKGTLTKDGKVVTFTLPAGEGISGVDFNPGFFAKTIAFTLTDEDGQPVDAKLIKMGPHLKPAPVPLVMQKTVQG